MRYKHHHPAKTMTHCARKIMSAITAAAVGLSLSSAHALAQADQRDLGAEIADEQQARNYAIEMVSTNFPASQAAAEEVLRGGQEELSAYAKSGMDEARTQDLRQIVVTISSLSEENVQNAAKQALDAGDIDSLSNFIDTGWQTAQTEDDRATAWKATQAPEGSVLKAAAEKALSTDTEEALSEFAATGADKARWDDKRREVYELSRSPLPSVAAGASEALMTDTDTAIESYLRYGQFVDAAQDSEKMSITELVDTAIEESDKAQRAASFAATNADQARRATEASRQATQKAKDEALAADAAQVRAGNAAASAGKLANQSAQVADNAVAAAAEARQALAQTADALARAASAASRARIAAQEAASRASAAGYDASMASQARQAAEQARDAARAADKAAQSFVHADAAAGFARTASGAAASAANNADAAAAAASEAAAAAGAGDQAAAEARAGAARARAAASRARAASNEVDGIVNQITELVQKARTAARQAADHANKSAQAAEDAAREAGNASAAAQRAGANAQSAQEAALKSIEAINLANDIAKLSQEAATQRQEQEAQYLKDQAIQANEDEARDDKYKSDQLDRRKKFEATLRKLGAYSELEESADGSGASLSEPSDISELRDATIAAAIVGGPSVSEAAKLALSSGKDQDLRQFATNGYSAALIDDERNQLRTWWATDPNEEVRNGAEEWVNADGAVVHWFATDEVKRLRTPILLEKAWGLKENAGKTVQQAADAAISEGTYDALDDFVNGTGYSKALHEDQLQQAYELERTGGPELKAAAEAAILGDREGLNEFITIEAARKSANDAEKNTHDQQVNALLEKGFFAAHRAAEEAAKAQESYFSAYGDARKAASFAQEATKWSGRAQQSAQRAHMSLASAQESLKFAKEQQQRSHTAANQAEQAANQASANSDQAQSFALDAHLSANQARSSAEQARGSAAAAGKDAAAAAQAADSAYQAATEKWQNEQVELQAAYEAGKIQDGVNTSSPGILESIKEAIGKEALNLLLDFIGVTDVINCFHGEISACLWTAVSLLPASKLLKAGKAIPVLRRLLSKTGEIRHLLSARRAERSTKLKELHNIPSCGLVSLSSSTSPKNRVQFAVNSTSFLERLRFEEIASTKCTVGSISGRIYRGGNYYQLMTRAWTNPLQAFRVQRHHIISSSAIKKEEKSLPKGMNRNNAPAIQMDPADHKETLSWGSGPDAKKYQEEQAQLVREGKIDEVFQREYEYNKNRFAGKYDQALDEMIDDALARGFLSKDFRIGNSRAADNLTMKPNYATLVA
ncbi:hypothetical protein [Corynebacterium accolens]|uniref:hypothetical protein n=1 Tax=Corynebacterium accolens TaxID=38284 RepID=UPI00254A5DDB|nr:hypothetical protein [Corynebacterium accolens]MDK8472784.1 hypothetical protein [Corynebacterium accolens]